MNYQGGKGGVFQKLINLMPPHEVYIETHLGGGAVMRNKCAARSNIGIEIDPEVVEMWTKLHPIGFELVQDDAVKHLRNYRFTGKELVYCDAGICQWKLDTLLNNLDSRGRVDICLG